MYVTNITDDYENLASINCTYKEINIDTGIPTIILTLPCGLSILCLMSLWYTH